MEKAEQKRTLSLEALRGFANFIWPLPVLSGLETIILSLTSTPWLGFLNGVFYAGILALTVSIFTKRGLIWRI